MCTVKHFWKKCTINLCNVHTYLKVGRGRGWPVVWFSVWPGLVFICSKVVFLQGAMWPPGHAQNGKPGAIWERAKMMCELLKSTKNKESLIVCTLWPFHWEGGRWYYNGPQLTALGLIWPSWRHQNWRFSTNVFLSDQGPSNKGGGGARGVSGAGLKIINLHKKL